MRDKLLAWCQSMDLVKPGDSLILAVSGGADSMAMLHFFSALASQWHLKLTCAHFNHHLRGEESDRDQAFVAEQCHLWHIPFVHDGANVNAIAREKGLSLEQAAREARYTFLSSVGAGSKIATAHTATDNTETVLLNLVRGASLQGLCGIPPKRGNLIRPMLCVTRQEILAYLEQEHVSFVEDSTNGDDFCRRNRLRHHVLPALLQENPALQEQLVLRSLLLRQDAEYLRQLAGAALDTCRTNRGIQVSKFLAQPPALHVRMIHQWLKEEGCQEVSMMHIQGVLGLLHSSKPAAQYRLPGLRTIAREYDVLIFQPQESPSICGSQLLRLPGETRLPGPCYTVKAQLIKNLKAVENTPYSFALKYDMIEQINLLRSRLAGDVLHRKGGSKPVKKLWIDAKIPQRLRSALPVLVIGDTVAAAAGIGADPRYLAQPGQKAWQITIQREDVRL